MEQDHERGFGVLLAMAQVGRTKVGPQVAEAPASPPPPQ